MDFLFARVKVDCIIRVFYTQYNLVVYYSVYFDKSRIIHISKASVLSVKCTMRHLANTELLTWSVC